MRECVTHHHACDCRESLMLELVRIVYPAHWSLPGRKAQRFRAILHKLYGVVPKNPDGIPANASHEAERRSDSGTR